RRREALGRSRDTQDPRGWQPHRAPHRGGGGHPAAAHWWPAGARSPPARRDLLRRLRQPDLHQRRQHHHRAAPDPGRCAGRTPHTFANPGEQPAVILATFTPALFVGYFREIASLRPGPTGLDLDEVAEAMARYATEVVTGAP